MQPPSYFRFLLAAACLALSACQIPGTGTRSVYFDSIDDTQISGRLFKPEGEGPFPAVVLLSHCGGAGFRHLTSTWPNFLVQNGYAAVTVATFKSRGYGRCDSVPYNIYKTHQAEDAYGALDYLAGTGFVDPGRVAVMGFSAGGFAINERIIGYQMGTNRRWDFSAAIAVYAGCFRLGSYAYSKNPMPLLQIAGEKDERLAQSCIRAAQSGPMQLHVIKGAYHAFDNPETTSLRFDSAGNPMRYSSSATREALDVVREFLALHLKR